MLSDVSWAQKLWLDGGEWDTGPKFFSAFWEDYSVNFLCSIHSTNSIKTFSAYTKHKFALSPLRCKHEGRKGKSILVGWHDKSLKWPFDRHDDSAGFLIPWVSDQPTKGINSKSKEGESHALWIWGISISMKACCCSMKVLGIDFKSVSEANCERLFGGNERLRRCCFECCFKSLQDIKLLRIFETKFHWDTSKISWNFLG